MLDMHTTSPCRSSVRRVANILSAACSGPAKSFQLGEVSEGRTIFSIQGQDLIILNHRRRFPTNDCDWGALSLEATADRSQQTRNEPSFPSAELRLNLLRIALGNLGIKLCCIVLRVASLIRHNGGLDHA